MSQLGPGARAFLRAFPRSRKAELHLHLEGAVFPSTLVSLSRARPDPLFPDLPSVRARLRFDGSQGFLLLYRDVCRLLASPSDYALLARDLVRRLYRERTAYAEVYVSPAIAARLGFAWHAVVDAIEPVFAHHERLGHGRIRVLLDTVRQWGPEAAERVLEAHRATPWSRVVGFGLGGDEASLPARAFAKVFARARAMGLGTVVHAGEWRGAESVAESLSQLKPDRIAHGIRAIEDASLVKRLAARGIPLDVCLASNGATGVIAEGVRHPVLELLRRGVRITLSTDDPGLFATSLRGEYGRLARLGATAIELSQVAATSRDARFG
ncbi:MAG: adenosine deaminase family protein [Thermoanaerobaculia bacterium]